MSDHQKLLYECQFLRLLPHDIRDNLLSCFRELSFPFGSPIVREGEAADSYYVIASGRARVLKLTESGDEMELSQLATGESFGEIGMLTGGVRTATVRASEPVVVLRLEKSDFDDLVGQSLQLREFVQLQLKHRTLQGFLRQYTKLAKAPLPVLERILELLRPANYGSGEAIIRQGDSGGSVFIVEEGRLIVYREDEGLQRVVGYLRPGDYFGELSLFKGSIRSATVETQTDCKLHVLSPADWETLVIEHPELQELVNQRVAHYRGSGEELRVPLDIAAADGDWLHRQKEDLAAGEGPEEAKPARKSSVRQNAVGKISFVPQIDEMDCGVASLAMVCSYFGRKVARPRLQELVGATTEGTSSSDVAAAARELGLNAEVVKKSPGQLGNLSCPAMLHLSTGHWVVLVETAKDKVRIADPARQIHWIPVEECMKKWSGYAVLFRYTELFDEGIDAAQRIWTWLWPMVRKVGGPIAATVGLTTLIAAFQVLLPLFLRHTVDGIFSHRLDELPGKLSDRLDYMVFGLVGALAATLLLMLLQRHLLTKATIKLDRAILEHIFERLLNLPLVYFLRRSVTDIRQRLVGARQICQFMMQNCASSLIALVQIVIYLSVMIYLSPGLSIWFLAVMVPIYLGLAFCAGLVLRPAFANLQETENAFEALQEDVIDGIESVKASGMEPQFRKIAVSNFLRIAQQQKQNQFNITAYEGTVQGIWVLSSILFLWLGGRQIIRGQEGDLTLGGFFAFQILIAMLYAPVMTVVRLWVDFLSASLKMERVNDVLQCRAEQDLRTDSLQSAASLQGQVEFRDVTVRFGGPESDPVLDGVSFTVPPGHRIGVVGRSGSGKTVLAKTIASLLRPASGRVLFDGVPTDKIRLGELRRQIGLVLQENHLFHGSVLANIAFGDPKPDEARANAVARMTGFHDQIKSLPNGFDTQISGVDTRLDTGLRQGIAITRALYRDPAVLVLDDATGSLDVETESVLVDKLEEALRSRTVILLTQRPGLVRHADHILVLDHGRIVEQGTHEELMGRRGLYYHLASRQMD